MDLLWIAGCLLSICAWCASTERHSVYWNSTNPKFVWDDYAVEVRLNDYLDIVCPHYPEGGGASGGCGAIRPLHGGARGLRHLQTPVLRPDEVGVRTPLRPATLRRSSLRSFNASRRSRWGKSFAKEKATIISPNLCITMDRTAYDSGWMWWQQTALKRLVWPKQVQAGQQRPGRGVEFTTHPTDCQQQTTLW
ncbi:hypothetical protein NQD34_008530 [Periophthalmus magnuspinnatus]|nr:hypothetical protein NQD34_008530 [Periophthalmus magnuspinnatus]